jgi:hypothetical protein
MTTRLRDGDAPRRPCHCSETVAGAPFDHASIRRNAPQPHVLAFDKHLLFHASEQILGQALLKHVAGVLSQPVMDVAPMGLQDRD